MTSKTWASGTVIDSAWLQDVDDLVYDKVVSSSMQTGATVGDRIDAAVTAAAGNIVIIPASEGVGEASSHPLTSNIFDMRGANASSAGRKWLFNYSDANGQNQLTMVNQLESYTLSSACLLANTNATGTLPGANPNWRTAEGAQFVGRATGAISGGGSGFVISGSEHNGIVSSTGGQIGYCIGATVSSQIFGTTAGTTQTDNVWGVWVTSVANTTSGAGAITPTTMFGVVIEDPSGAASSKGSLWSKGNMTVGGDIALNRNGVSSTSSFQSGGAANYYYLSVGNSADRCRWAVAGATNDFITGTAQHDSLLYTPGATNLFLGTNSALAIKIDTNQNCVFYGIKQTSAAAPTLTITTNVITPTKEISFVGAGLIKTITVPSGMLGGRITIIPTAAFTTDTTGNIAIASTAVIGRAMDFIYDSGTTKWYPTY